MARTPGIGKIGRVLPIISGPLEEEWDIPFRVVGYKEWFTNSFEPGALQESEKIIVDRSGKQMKPIVQWLLAQRVLGEDTETTGEDKRSGLDPWREGSRLLMLQIGTPAMVYLIQPELIPFLVPVLTSDQILHLFQNGVYDFKYILVKYHIEHVRFYDTMLAEQLLTSGLSGYRVGLADQARRYPPYRIISKQTRQEFVNFKERGERFDRRMVLYMAKDIDLMFPVMTAQITELKKWKLEVAAQDEFEIIPCTAMMELGGVYINQETLRLALSYWEERKEELEQQVLSLYDSSLTAMGKKKLSLLPEIHAVFDLDSQAKKLAALRELGFKIENVKRDTLLEQESPITNLLAEYSEVMKVISTYGESMLRRINPKTGRLHPEFNQLGQGDAAGKDKKGTIATGRYSSDFQQLPRSEERFAAVKNPDEVTRLGRRFATEIAAARYGAVPQGATV